MILSYIERKYWVRVMFENEVIGAICKDGLLYMFDAKDIEPHLEKFPHNNRVWWFNATKDRECAERRDGRILVNPMAVGLTIGHYVIKE